MSEELKPCPFCGGEPAHGPMLGVWCNNDQCAIVGQVFSGGGQHWNRRSAPVVPGSALRAAFDFVAPSFAINVERFENNPEQYKYKYAADMFNLCKAVIVAPTQPAAPKEPT